MFKRCNPAATFEIVYSKSLDDETVKVRFRAAQAGKCNRNVGASSKPERRAAIPGRPQCSAAACDAAIEIIKAVPTV